MKLMIMMTFLLMSLTSFAQNSNANLETLAQKHGFSIGAVQMLNNAFSQSRSLNQVQFNISEFGGMGSWMKGGMMMIGDMFNQNLKLRVGSLCEELSQLRQNSHGDNVTLNCESCQKNNFAFTQPMPSPQPMNFMQPMNSMQPMNFAPFEAGVTSSGQSNNVSYKYYGQEKKLVITLNGSQTYTYLDIPSISGVSSSQSSVDGIQKTKITFSTQEGTDLVIEI